MDNITNKVSKALDKTMNDMVNISKDYAEITWPLRYGNLTGLAEHNYINPPGQNSRYRYMPEWWPEFKEEDNNLTITLKAPYVNRLESDPRWHHEGFLVEYFSEVCKKSKEKLIYELKRELNV
jgi:hypothetical protein